MKILLVVLGVLFGMLQYSLWFGDGSLPSAWLLKHEVSLQREENARLLERNQILRAEVVDLKQGIEAIEERARVELGMIKKGEVFYQVIDK